MGDYDVKVMKPTSKEEQRWQDHADSMRRKASVTGKTVRLILSVSPQGVPENLRGDLKRLQEKAEKVYVQIQADTLDALCPPGSPLPAPGQGELLDLDEFHAPEFDEFDDLGDLGDREESDEDADEADDEADGVPELSDEDKASPILTDSQPEAELPAVAMPAPDGPDTQDIPNLGNQYRWKRKDSKTWDLQTVEEPTPTARKVEPDDS